MIIEDLKMKFKQDRQLKQSIMAAQTGSSKEPSDQDSIEVENIFLIANKLAPWKYEATADRQSEVQFILSGQQN